MMKDRSLIVTLLLLLAVVCVIVAASTSLGAYLESDYPDKPPARQPRPLPRPPEPPPPHRNEIARLIDQCTIGAPHHYRGLTIFPVQLARPVDPARYLTLDEAFSRRLIEVTATGVVAQLAVRNQAREYVFAMAGEVLAGGKQNRLMREDVLLPPRSKRIIVPVYCGERGRWQGADDGVFKSSNRMVRLQTRTAAQSCEPQSRIWDDIRENARETGVESKTEDFTAIPNSPKVAKQLSEYRNACRRIWRPLHNGIVVAIRGRIVGADVFGSERLFTKLRDKLIESYALGCIGKPLPRHPRRRILPDRHAALRYLRATYRARQIYCATPGAGRAIALSGAATGRALVFNGNAVHLCLYNTIGPPVPLRPAREPARRSE